MSGPYYLDRFRGIFFAGARRRRLVGVRRDVRRKGDDVVLVW